MWLPMTLTQASHKTVHSRPLGAPLLAALCFALLAIFLVVPVLTVIYVAFKDTQSGAFTLVNFADFARNDLFMRSLANSVYVSAMSVVLATLLAMPLAYITMRFEFRGTIVLQTLGVIPLDHAALCRSGGDAIAVRAQRQHQHAAGRRL